MVAMKGVFLLALLVISEGVSVHQVSSTFAAQARQAGAVSFLDTDSDALPSRLASALAAVAVHLLKLPPRKGVLGGDPTAFVQISQDDQDSELSALNREYAMRQHTLKLGTCRTKAYLGGGNAADIGTVIKTENVTGMLSSLTCATLCAETQDCEGFLVSTPTELDTTPAPATQLAETAPAEATTAPAEATTAPAEATTAPAEATTAATTTPQDSETRHDTPAELATHATQPQPSQAQAEGERREPQSEQQAQIAQVEAEVDAAVAQAQHQSSDQARVPPHLRIRPTPPQASESISESMAMLQTTPTPQSQASCTLVKDIGANPLYNSGVCLRRNGCDGQLTERDCVWNRMEDAFAGAFFQPMQSHPPRQDVKYEAICRSLCEEVLGCQAYSWRKRLSLTDNSITGNGMHECVLYDQVLGDSAAVTGLCQRELVFVRSPDHCWVDIDAPCKPGSEFPRVEVPLAWGDAYVELSVWPPKDLHPRDNKNVSRNGFAEFPEFNVLASHVAREVARDVTLRASAASSLGSCPVDSETVHMYVDAFETHWVWQKEFWQTGQGLKPFLIVRFGANCVTVTMMMALALLFILSSINWMLGHLGNGSYVNWAIILVVLLISLVFLWDFYHAWRIAGCQQAFLKQTKLDHERPEG